MKNLIVTSKDGIMCEIAEQESAKTIDFFKTVSVSEKFYGKNYSVCLNVTNDAINWRFVRFSNKEQILLTVSKLLEYVNSEQCHISLS